VKVRGGEPPRGRDRGAYSEHGFIGQKSEVVKVITDWAQGKPVPKQVWALGLNSLLFNLLRFDRIASMKAMGVLYRRVYLKRARLDWAIF